MFRQLCLLSAITAFAGITVAQGNLVPLPPHSSVYNGFSRGYSFTANTDFFIQAFELPTDAFQTGDTAGVVCRVNGVQAFYSAGNAAALMTPPGPIQIFTGDIVDVVGNWSPATPGTFTAHNSYGSTAPYATTIEGVAHTLDRTGVQNDIGNPAWVQGTQYLAPSGGSIGRVLMYTSPPAGTFASFTVAPGSGSSPLFVQFTDTSFTSDPGGIALYEWDLDGDGLFNDAFVQNPSFTYTSCGTIDVSLRITDASAVQSTATVTGAVVVDPITADFSVAELVPGAGIWQFTDLSSPNPSAWAWDFDGDGIVDDTAQNPVYVQPVPASTLQLPNCTLTATGVGGCNTDTVVRNLFVTGYGVAEGPTVGGNGISATPAVGTYWDVEILNPEGVNITSLDVGVYGFAGAADVRVYITQGTHVGNTGTPNAWTLAGEGTCTFVGGGTVAAPEFANVTLNQSFYLPPGSYGVALYHINPAGTSIQVSYTNAPAASPYGNGDVRIHPNGVACSSTSELGPCALPRLWNGRIYYETCSVSNNAAAGTFAGGCANSAGTVPNLSVTSLPQLGSNYSLNVDAGLAAPAAVLIAVGDSKDTFNGQPLPFDLGVLLGMTGCELNVSVLALDVVIANPGVANPWSFAIPNNPSLMCFTFFQQGAVLDPAANPFGWVMSNAMASVVGN